MPNISKRYELQITFADVAGEGDVAGVFLFEKVGTTSHMVAQSQCNTNVGNVPELVAFTQAQVGGVVAAAFVEAGILSAGE